MNRWIKITLFPLLLLSAGQAWAQVGVATEVHGEVSIERAGDFYMLGEGVELFAGDVVRSGADSGAQLEMNDGSMISISANTEMTITDYRLAEDNSVIDASIELVEGWLRFAVARLRSGDASYRFAMPTAVLGVRGTEGVIEVSGDEASPTTQILLEDGEVEVAEEVRSGRLSGQKVRLRPGQFAERRFGRMLIRRAMVTAAFRERMPARFKVKLKRRIKFLKRRGIAPGKVRKSLYNKLKQQKLKQQKRRELLWNKRPPREPLFRKKMNPDRRDVERKRPRPDRPEEKRERPGRRPFR